MEKFAEKKNLGLPSVILCALAYLIGYFTIYNFEGSLLVAVAFAVMVFAFNFDDKVKSAVKQAYIISILINLIYICFRLIRVFINLISTDFDFKNFNLFSDVSYDTLSNPLQKGLYYIYVYVEGILDVVVVVIFVLFIIQALRGKEFKIKFISKMAGDIVPVAPQMGQPMYQQPVMHYQQPMQGQPMPGQPMPGQPIQGQPMQQPGQAPVGVTCKNCGRINQPGATFCASCGTKLQ